MRGFNDRGESVPVCARAELARDPMQRRIALAASEGRHFVCTCSPLGLKLFPVETPGGGWTVRCATFENFKHAKTCFARAEMEDLTNTGKRRRIIFLPSILLAPTEAAGRATTVAPAPANRARAGENPHYGTLTELVQSLLEAATMRAMRLCNPVPLGYCDTSLRSPTTEEIFFEFLGQLSDPLFADGRSPFEAAAAAGLHICWGLTPMSLAADLKRLAAEGGTLRFSTGTYWGEAGQQDVTRPFVVSQETALDMKGKVTAFGRLIAPPYFYFLTADRSNQVARIVVVPVASVVDSVCCIESHPERVLVRHLLKQGLALLKPNGTADFSNLGPRLWPMPTTDDRGYLCRRPDLITFSRGVSIVQLVGSTDAPYLAGVEASIAELRATLEHPAIVFRKISLAEIIGAALDGVTQMLRKGAKG